MIRIFINYLSKIFREMGWLFFVFILAAYIMLGYSLYCIYKQGYVIKHYVPVEAKIMSSEVKYMHYSRGKHYSPIATYQYHVNGRTFISTEIDVTEVPTFGTSERAHQYLAQFPIGHTHTAYYDPKNPNKAVLVKESNYFIYFVFYIFHFGAWLFGMIFLPSKVQLYRMNYQHRSILHFGNLYKLHAVSTRKGEAKLLTGAACLYLGIVGGLGIHYLHISTNISRIWPHIGNVIFLVPGLILLGYAVRFWQEKIVYLPTAAVNSERLIYGRDYKLRVHWAAPEAIDVKTFVLNLVKEKISPKRGGFWNPAVCRSDRVEQWENIRIGPGEEFEREMKLSIPKTKPPRCDEKEQPMFQYRWYLEAQIYTDRQKDLVAYPLWVEYPKNGDGQV